MPLNSTGLVSKAVTTISVQHMFYKRKLSPQTSFSFPTVPPTKYLAPISAKEGPQNSHNDLAMASPQPSRVIRCWCGIPCSSLPHLPFVS